MNPNKKLLGFTAAAMMAVSTASMAADVTIIQVSDLHGNMVPHAGIIENADGSETIVTQGGGIAKVATVINEIRNTSNTSLTLGVGDSIHGSAEVLFTMGDSIMPAFNALGLEAYTPGNWEFAYGPAVFRARFTNTCKANPDLQKKSVHDDPNQFNAMLKALCPPIAGNMIAMTSADGVPGVTKADFEVLANNLYNGGPYPTAAGFYGDRPLKPYKVFDKDGVRIGVIGITTSITPQQPAVFGRTFEFTQGVEELPADIAAAKAEGADIIVVMSELGLPQNVQIGREFPEVDVILSAHSHEVTTGAILADEGGYAIIDPFKGMSNGEQKRLDNGAAIIVEAGEDLYVGRLDLTIEGGRVVDFAWEAVPVGDDVAEDETVAALVADQEKYFIDGPDFREHTFLPAAFCSPSSPCPTEGGIPVHEGGIIRKGLRLVDPLDTVVGSTDVLLHRHHALEGVMNNFIADAFHSTLEMASKNARAEWANLDVLSMTNGFRFDTVVLPADMVANGQTFWDEREPGQVTLRDLWSYFPIAAGMTAADYNGTVIEQNLNGILANVFAGNPYVQRGGWYLGLSSNMKQRVDVVRRPLSTSGSRIVDTRIDDGVSWKLIDPSKRYIIASCYGHTFPIGRSCRAEGGANTVFFALSDPEDYTSAIMTEDPIPTPNGAPLIDNKTPKSPIFRAAPDNYMHPIHALRRYLDEIGNVISEYNHGEGRVTHVNSRVIDDCGPAQAKPNRECVTGSKTFLVDPIENYFDSSIVQSIEGMGPSFLERGVIVQ